MNRYIIPILLAFCASTTCRFAFGQPPADFTNGVSLALGATNQESGLHLLPAGRETKTRVANSDAWGDLTNRGVVAKTPLSLRAGEVVEFPLTFPRVTRAGDFGVEIAAVVVEAEDFVETQTKWRR